MPLTILALADEIHPALYEHFDPKRWGNVDLVLSSGDLPPEYLDFICCRLNVPVIYVRGNHDCEYPRSRYEGFHNAHGRILTVRGLRVAGFEGCRRYNERECQYTEGEMRMLVRRARLQALFRGAPHVVLTHAAPAGCHEGTDVAHSGFESFRKAIEVWQPAYFVHGHTHHHYSRETVGTLGSTTIVNAYPFHVFQVEDRQRAAHHPRLQRHPERDPEGAPR